MANWCKTLGYAERFDLAQKKTERVVDHLLHLTFLHEMNRHIIYSRVLASQIPRSRAARAFNVFRESSFQFEILRLCALWDRGSGDRESIPSIVDLVCGLDLSDFLMSEDRSNEMEATKSKLGAAIENAATVTQSDEIKWLRTHRDHHIAHALEKTQVVQKLMRNAQYGHEGKLLVKTVAIVDDLHLSLNGKGFMWEDSRRIAAKCSAELWENCKFFCQVAYKGSAAYPFLDIPPSLPLETAIRPVAFGYGALCAARGNSHQPVNSGT